MVGGIKQDRMGLTKRTQEVLSFVESYMAQHGRSPTAAEIATGIGITSTGTVNRYVKSLVDSGFIKTEPNRRRNIRLLTLDNALDEFSLPLLGNIAAGGPIEAVEQNERLNVASMVVGPNRFALQVRGDSMVGDNICDGDYVICESCQQAGCGAIVVALVDREEVTLKRIEDNSDGTLSLVPSNPTMHPMVYDRGRVEVQGRYLGLLRFTVG